MKRERGKISMLKKILILAVLISLLSNHLLILGEVANIALASDVEWQSDFTSNVNDTRNQQNEADDPDSGQENVAQNATENVPAESDGDTSENQVVEEQAENTVSEENSDENLINEDEIVEDKVLSEEEIKAIQEITTSTDLVVNKLIRFDNENGKGTVVDLTFKIKINSKDYTAENLDVNFELPNLSGILPYAYRLEETSDNVEFAKDDSGRIILNMKNVAGDSEKEVRLLLVYSADAFSASEVKISGDVRMEISGQEVLAEFSNSKEVKESTDILATYEVTADTSSKYKGYLYANTLLANKKDITYTTTDVIEIKDESFIDEIIVENNIDKIITDSKEIDLTNKVTYKSTSIDVEEFDAILGTDGYIEIYNQAGEKLGEINSESQVKNNRYTFYYNTNVDIVVFKIKNIESNEILHIKNEKAIIGSDAFSIEDVKTFKSIKTSTVNKIAKIVDDNEIIVQRISSECNINLEETESKMTLNMSTNDFVTTDSNDVTFSVTLKTNEEKYELFRNPTISLELPSAVQNVEIKSINLMYKNGLALGSWNVVKNEQGSNVIQVSLTGTQEEYAPGTMIEGTTVLISAKLDLNKITANGKSAVKLRYTNEIGTNISYALEGKDCTDVEVNYVSRSGILKESKILNFNDENEILVSYEDEAVVGSIESNNSAKVATVSTVIMNNYSEEIENVEIVGKIPTIGNTKDGVDLNTTFDTTLAGPVNLNGLVGKVYYSYNENQEKDSNEWVENVTDFSQVKSFKVVLENKNMKVGEKIELSYNINIPENVGYNASAYNLFTTYYDYNNNEIEDTSILGLESEIKAIELSDCQIIEETSQLSVGTQVTRSGDVLAENDEVNEGQILRYNVVVTNTSNQPITNIKLKGFAENANSYYWYTFKDISSTTNEEILQGTWKEDADGEHPYETLEIESLAIGETKVFSYQIKVKNLDAISNPEVYGKFTISADGIEEKEYQTIKNKVTDAVIELVTRKSGYEDVSNLTVYSGDMFNIFTTVKNISDKDLQNVKVNVFVPDTLEYEAEETSVYNDNVDILEQNLSTGKIITFTIFNLPKGETKNVSVAANVKSFDLTEATKDIIVRSNSTIDGIVHYSNDYIREVYQSETSYNVEYTANLENKSVVKNGDNIKYTIKVTNTGIVDGYFDFVNYLPYGLDINGVKATLPDGTEKDLEVTEYNYVLEEYVLAPGQQLIVEVDGVVNVTELRTNQTTIVNSFKLTPVEYLNEYEEIVFYVDPSQIIEEPDYGTTDDEEEIIEETEDDFDFDFDLGLDTEEEENVVNETEENTVSDEQVENKTENTVNETTENTVSNEQTESTEENANTEKEQNNVQNTTEQETENNVTENNVEEESSIVSETTVKAVTYSISGKAWLDSNENGLYEEEENLKEIKVMLFKGNTADSSYIKDSNIYKTATTNDSGEYIFSNLEEGKYIVVFDYDNAIYDVSAYQVTEGTTVTSSNVIAKQLKLNSSEKNYAVSDIVELTTGNIDNINIGLKENSDFDMAIETYVKEVTIENEKGVQTETFSEDNDLTKIEIASKYLNNTNLTIEYRVRVTNNGVTSGYVNQISMQIPEGLEFNSESTSNWQLGEDGILYCSTLNKILLESGESREISLILTKTMTDEATGIYKNTAQILESTNDLQLLDNNTDNDKAEVELFITVKTGAIYYILVIVIALMVAFIAMLIVSKLIKDDKTKVNFINKIIIIVSLVIIVALCLIIKVYGSYNSGTLATENINTYYNRKFELKTYTTVPANYGSIHTLQCVEGSNVSNAPDWQRRVVSVADITGLTYKTKSIKGTKSGESETAGMLGYLSYIIEEARKRGRGDTWDYKEIFVDMIRSRRSGVNAVLNISINGGSNSGHSAGKIADAKKYAQNLASSGGKVSKKDDVTKLEYNSNYNGFGAIYATFPTGSKLQISSDKGETWKNCTKVVTSKGTVTFNYANCNNKKFYIPMSAVEKYDLEKVRVRIVSEVDVYKARIVALFGTDTSSQNQGVLRGSKTTQESKISYKLDAIANVKVTKKVIQKADAKGKNKETASTGDYLDRGDYAYFRISIVNGGSQNVTLDIKDTYDTNQYEFVALYKGNSKLERKINGNWSETITVSKGTTNYTMILKVKDNVSANVNTKLMNSVAISNFKVNNKSIPNKTGNQVSDSDYVRCKQYRISVKKTVESITSASNAPKSTANSVEVGDLIKYQIVVKNNNGSKSAAYGAISYKLVEDIPSGFTVNAVATGWKSASGKYEYSGVVASGSTPGTSITMRVSEKLLNTQAVQKKNTVTITEVKNRNGVDVSKYLLNSTLSSSATVKILGYNLSISKYVSKANGKAVSDYTLCELGDKLEYTIQVKNTGTSTANFGSIYSINLEDTFKTDQLMFLSSSGTGWVKNSNTSYTYSNALKPGETATLKIELQVILESKSKVKISNTATIKTGVNKNNISLTHIIPASSTATVEYQTYDVNVWKYISSHNSKAVTDRQTKTNTEKYNSPIEVEKYDYLEYTVIVKNAGTTIMNNVTFVDTLETGLSYNSTISVKKYNSSGNVDSTSSNIVEKVNGNTITYTYNGELNGGEYFEVIIKCDVVMSNMYLANLRNEVNITSIHNRNNVDLIEKDIINYIHKENYDYVRLKDLLVTGKVWIDENKDGKMDDKEGKLEGIKVILHDVTNNKVAITYTDSEGKYSFAETNGTKPDGSEATSKMVNGGDNSGRIVKATGKDEKTGNYTTSSKCINYYLEFYYNGGKYEATVYAGDNGMKNINSTDKSIGVDYMTDSNAYEYTDIREKVNKQLETIEYNTGIDGIIENDDGSNTTELAYTKNDHESIPEVTDKSGISAYTFINKNSTYGSGLENGKNINMLFLAQTGETEYLKYMNLGLVTRELDLSISQDLDNVKTTINGEQMTYFFNQGSKSPYGGEYVTGGVNNALNYQFEVYASDYYYKHKDAYKDMDDVVKAYKEHTELNTEITYKMTVTNNNLEKTDGVYTKIREIADFYSSDFVPYDPTNNTKVVKVTGEDGYLKEETINKVEAWYEYTDESGAKSTGTVILNNESAYPQHAKVDLGTTNGKDKYNVIYLSGFDNVKLSQGEKIDIYIKFVVDTKDGTEDTDLILGAKNNIVEINAYSTYFETNDKPAGFVDKDSNPGNLGLRKDSNQSFGVENTSIEEYSQYEDDTYKTGITLKLLTEDDPDPTPDLDEKWERIITGTVWDDARSNSTGKDGKTQYLGNGVMNIGGDDKNPNAESNKKIKASKEAVDSYAQGIKVNLVEIVKVPVNGQERTYEVPAYAWSDAVTSTRSNAEGAYRLESFIPGDYIIRFEYGESVEDVVYNGQEYKSTTYYNIEDQVTSAPESGDNVLKKLEEAGRSDARDDEIRRLEVISYSEVVNNRKTEEAQKVLPEEYSESFMKNTSMNADTATFPVRTEKTSYGVYEYTFKDYTERKYKIENIDFGLEYRPETNVTISEFLSEIKLTTSDGKILVDINFDNVYEVIDEVQTDKIIETQVNPETSIGYENLQYLPTIDDVKGLAYLNVDMDLLQGCTVDITYVFSVNNDSEVDRISSRLYNLRYQADALGYESYYDDVYTAAGTARNELYDVYYDTDSVTYGIKDKASYNGTDGYYGKYLGSTYYTGVAAATDVVAELKVDKILDYVDNDMTMDASKNSTENKYWTTMTNEELLNQGLISEKLFATVEEKSKSNGQVEVKQYKKLLDAKGITYDVDTRHNLAVSVDDKISTNDNDNANKSLSKFLTPYVTNPKASGGNIYMVASKVVSGESDTESMTYDNSAEIIQYTSVTGRVTKLSTTVGNLEMSSNPDSVDYEDDEDYVERVTLTPPTGLEKSKYYLSLAKDQIIMVTIIIAVVIVVIVLKKNLKNVTFKKFYK